MATAIVWDDDPPVEPLHEQPKQTLLNPDSKLSSEAYRAMYLGTVDTGELVAELAKRGYDAHPRITYYMPATVTTPITVPTVTTTSGTFTVPSTVGNIAGSTVTYGSAQYYSQLMQNVATLGKASPPLHSEQVAAEPSKSASLSTWKALIGRDK